MSNHITLDHRGTYWESLSHREQEQILKQFPNIKLDPNYTKYRYSKTNFFNWGILNSMSLPLGTNRVIF